MILRILAVLLLLVGVAQAQPISGGVASGIAGGTPLSAGTVTATGSTTARTLAAHFSDIVSALDNGCAAVVNNAAADASPCIQATLTLAASQKRKAHFPGGIYYIASPITWPSTPVIAVGDGFQVQSASVGTMFHVVSASFLAGGTYAGQVPITMTNANSSVIDNVGFTEDQPADTGGWAPNDYGPMILLNGGKMPRFSNIYLQGVNKFLDILSANGIWIDHISGQVFNYGFMVEANTDFMHLAHVHMNDFAFGIGGAGAATYTQNNASFMISERNDNPIMEDITGYGLLSLITFGTNSGGASTGVTNQGFLTDIQCDKCFEVLNVTGIGTTLVVDKLLGNGKSFDGLSYLLGSNLVKVSGNNSIITLQNVKGLAVGDSDILLSGTGIVLTVNNLVTQFWGGNANGAAACNTIYAVAVGASNTVQVTGTQVISGGCSSLVAPVTTYLNGSRVGWTPSVFIGGSNTGVTTSSVGGVYQVVYNEVFVEFGVALSSKGGLTGAVTIHGLQIPPNSSGSWGISGQGACAQVTGTSSLSGPVFPLVSGSSTTVQLDMWTTTGVTALLDTNITDTATFRCSFHYFL